METLVQSFNEQELGQEFLTYGEYRGEFLGARPLPITIDKLRALWDLHSKHKIFFDDLTKYSFERFCDYAVRHMHFPIEVVTIPERKHLGIFYLTDVHKAETEDITVYAFFHGSFWDAKAGPRREIVREIIRIWTRVLKLKRLMALAPAKAVGALHQLEKLGFGGPFEYIYTQETHPYDKSKKSTRKAKVEGVWRQAKKMDGVWVDMLQVAMTEEELRRV